MSFQGLAFLLLPADPGLTATIDEADDRWSLPASPNAGTSVVIWGRGPLLSGTRPVVAARSSFDRERGLRSIRRWSPASFRVVGVHRLPPAELAGGRLRNRLRGALLGGAIVELWSQGQVRRVIDAVTEAAGGAPVKQLMPGAGGSAVIRLHGVAGGDVVLRAARRGDPVDPDWAATALETLEPLALREVPRLLKRGEVAGATWSIESVLSGRRPVRISAVLAQGVARLCGVFPRSERPATAHEQDVRRVADRFPHWATLISQVTEEVSDVARAVPSTLRHGDLWAGNLLARRGRLTGIVDWDAWHPSALPGVDLLHLVATAEGLRTKQGLGHTWLRQPWESEDYRSVASDYWKISRIVPNARFLRAVGMAWWAGHVAASIRRLPRLAEDERWVASNVEEVLQALGGRS
ncbi:MAG TPA: phosphotransferase [Actinomycetota bacterium]|nr:phosphotransferase [Actinomycetota bacterium]